jgi:hypothetical protein
MIWLASVSLVAGVLLAQRFKVVVLAPATFVVVVVALTIGRAHGVWLTILMMATASLGIQIGYFLGMLIQYGIAVLLTRKSSYFSDPRTARNPSIFRTPISNGPR